MIALLRPFQVLRRRSNQAWKQEDVLVMLFPDEQLSKNKLSNRLGTKPETAENRAQPLTRGY